MIENQYLYKGKWSEIFLKEYEENHLSTITPYITVIDNGTLLPAKPDSKTFWGLGGVLDADGHFVAESGLDNVFGGIYADKRTPEFLDEEIIYLGILPRHWGHFIIDVLCKLWCLESYENQRVAFCSLDWGANITGNYMELLRLAGISEERLLFIDKPYRARKILIPSRTLGYENDYHPLYLKTVDLILSNVQKEAQKAGLKPISNVYFSRTKLKHTKWNEIGEKRIEKVYRDNGYTVLFPEKLSAVQQIFYYHNAKNIACVSGTLPHNIVFSNEDACVTIFNRTCVPNPPQIRIDQMKKINTVYVDAFHSWTLTHPRTYGGIDHYPIWITLNENAERYFNDRGFILKECRLQRVLERCIIDNLHFSICLLRHKIKVILVKTGIYQKIKSVA